MNKLVVLLILLCFLSCDRSTPEPDPNREGYACGQVIAYRTGGGSTLTVAYSERINRYYISYPASSSTVVGLVCNLPKEYQVAGKAITFDGAYAPVSQETESELLTPFPNQQVYHLKITKIY